LEAAEAAEWYAARSSTASGHFIQQLAETITRLVTSPRLFPIVECGARRALLKDLTYSIVFREAATTIQIIAVAHGSRKPGYWRNRTF
jgi:plasmid stabilization system protein ParE